MVCKVICERCGHIRRRRHPDAQCHTCKQIDIKQKQICKCGGKKTQTAVICKKCETTCECGGKKCSVAVKCMNCVRKVDVRPCVVCGKAITKRESWHGVRKTCSNECMAIQRQRSAVAGAMAVKKIACSNISRLREQLTMQIQKQERRKRFCICCGVPCQNKEFCHRCFGNIKEWARRLDKKKTCSVCGIVFDNRISQSTSACSDACRRQTEAAVNTRRNTRHKRRVLTGRSVVTKLNIQSIYVRDNWQCVYCGCRVYNYKAGGHLSGDMATLDHVLPLTLGGEHVPDNVVTACWNCNTKKGAEFYAE